MNSEDTVRRWQAAIVAQAEAKLGRQLADGERRLVSGTGGFLALEMIEDTVRSSSPAELAEWFSRSVPRTEER